MIVLLEHVSSAQSCVRNHSKSSLSSAPGDIAQLVEHRLCKPRVRGSNPLVSTTLAFVVKDRLG